MVTALPLLRMSGKSILAFGFLDTSLLATETSEVVDA